MKYIFFLSLSLFSCSSVPSPDVDIDHRESSILIKPEQEMTFEDKVRLQEEIIHRQDLELKKQERELMELKRQDIYNKVTENYAKTHEVK